MKVSIKATNLDLTPAIKKAIEEKIAVLGKFIPHLNGSVEAFVEVAIETAHHRKGKVYYAEANIKVPGTIIRSEAREENIYKAINTVSDELQALLKRYKKKKIARKERAARVLKRRSRYSSLVRREEKGRRMRDE